MRQPVPRWSDGGKLEPTAAFAIVADVNAVPQGLPGALAERPPLLKTLVRIGKLIAEALALLALLALFFVRLPQVNGRSMEPQLHAGEHVLLNTLAYDFRIGGGDRPLIDVALHPIPQGAVVAFVHAGADGPQVYVKRVIGVPGDTIAIARGQVFVNGHALVEQYVSLRDQATLASLRVPANAFFMLGDNRGESDDSRVFGAVPRTAIIGRAQLVVWPLNRAGRIR